MVRETERTYKARLVFSAKNAFEAGEKMSKLSLIAAENGIDVHIDEVGELVLRRRLEARNQKKPSLIRNFSRTAPRLLCRS